MRAAVIHHYGPPEALVVEDIEQPRPGPRDLLVEVHASSINPVDTKIRAGAQRLLLRYPLPWVLGLDVSGVVVETGPKVTRFAVGDEVFASPRHSRPGCYAEYVAVDEREAAHKPSRLSHAQAAGVPLAALTAWDCLVEVTRVRAGDKVLVHAGAGGVGSIAIQLAKHLGAEVATTCSEANAALVRRLGADVVVDYRRQRFEEILPPQDVVLDSLGFASVARSLVVLARGGRLVSIQSDLPRRTARWGQLLGTLLTGLSMAWLPVRAWLRYGVRARSLIVREPHGGHLAKIAELIDAGAIEPLVDRVVGLEQVAEAHRYAEGGHVRGKVVLAVKASADPADVQSPKPAIAVT